MRRLLPSLVVLAVPLAGLFLLLGVPRLDLTWEHQPAHFWLVLVAAEMIAVDSGLGYLIIDARNAGKRYDLVVEMDADLSHDPAELPGLLSAAHGFHLVVGSRYVPGGSVTNWSRTRVALSRAGNAYARRWLGLPLHDATSGFRVFHRELLAHLTADPIRSDGYGFQIELVLRAWDAGYSLGEVPITFRERQHGHSKISRKIVIEALWLVTLWGARMRLARASPRNAHSRQCGNYAGDAE